MGSIIVVSDAPPEEWQGFLTETMNTICKKKIKGIAVVALLSELDEDGCSALTGYFNMSTEDRAMAAAHIQGDVVDGIARANLRHWLDRMEQEEEDGGDEDGSEP